VASLSVAAQAARVDAMRLRGEAHELRLATRGNLIRSRQRLGRAHAEACRARAKLVEPLPSPWSHLRWTQTYEALELTLVPLPPAVG
jgi:hypothetical protein